MIVLTVNSGSTSVRLAAFDAGTDAALHELVRERYEAGGVAKRDVLARFVGRLPRRDVSVVAHRIVHGGTRFTRPTPIDATVEAHLRELSELAPLHNPPALEWLAAARDALGDGVPQVAVFDTAFFSALPRVAAEYAVPRAIGVDAGVRRYGFHGLAHESMWRRWRDLRPRLPEGGRLITLQLGGGCSVAAIERGKPIETSMGFSPLEGLVMATRSGDVDAAIVPFLSQRLGESASRVVERLNTESGLLGVSRRSSSVRELLDDASPEARFAVELYCHRARQYVGACLAVLGGCDGIVFGGGVGEHTPEVRAMILSGMTWAGIEIDARANAAATGGDACISSSASGTAVHVVRIDEDSALARAAASSIRT